MCYGTKKVLPRCRYEMKTREEWRTKIRHRNELLTWNLAIGSFWTGREEITRLNDLVKNSVKFFAMYRGGWKIAHIYDMQ